MRKRVFLGLGVVAVFVGAGLFWSKSKITAEPRPPENAQDRRVIDAPVADTNDPAEAFASTTPAGQALIYVRNETVFDASRPLIDRLDDLAKLAEADPSMAYDVGTAVGSCAAVPIGDAVVEGMLDQGTKGATKAAELTLDQQDFCVGLSKADFDLGLALLDRAAAAGLVEAQVNYADLAGVILFSREEYRFDQVRQEAYRRTAIRHLGQAARSGNPTAFANLSAIYSDGRLVPRDPSAAARYYREYLQRSGRHSARDLKHLEALEAAAK